MCKSPIVETLNLLISTAVKAFIQFWGVQRTKRGDPYIFRVVLKVVKTKKNFHHIHNNTLGEGGVGEGTMLNRALKIKVEF